MKMRASMMKYGFGKKNLADIKLILYNVMCWSTYGTLRVESPPAAGGPGSSGGREAASTSSRATGQHRGPIVRLHHVHDLQKRDPPRCGLHVVQAEVPVELASANLKTNQQ